MNLGCNARMFADRKWLSQVPGSATPRGRRLEPIRVAPQSLMFFFRKTKAIILGSESNFQTKLEHRRTCLRSGMRFWSLVPSKWYSFGPRRGPARDAVLVWCN